MSIQETKNNNIQISESPTQNYISSNLEDLTPSVPKSRPRRNLRAVLFLSGIALTPVAFMPQANTNQHISTSHDNHITSHTNSTTENRFIHINNPVKSKKDSQSHQIDIIVEALVKEKSPLPIPAEKPKNNVEPAIILGEAPINKPKIQHFTVKNNSDERQIINQIDVITPQLQTKKPRSQPPNEKHVIPKTEKFPNFKITSPEPVTTHGHITSIPNKSLHPTPLIALGNKANDTLIIDATSPGHTKTNQEESTSAPKEITTIIDATGTTPELVIDAQQNVKHLNSPITQAKAEVDKTFIDASTFGPMLKQKPTTKPITTYNEPPANTNGPKVPVSKSAREEIPPRLLDIFFKAEKRCPNLNWTYLAAISKVESTHGRLKVWRKGRWISPATMALNGDINPKIFGIQLRGQILSNGHSIKEIKDTDNGTFDGDKVYDRAVGPMQFIPATFKAYGVDGNQDGKKDPQNMFDAVAATANLLCSANEFKDPNVAIHNYNHSNAYVNFVIKKSTEYKGLN